MSIRAGKYILRDNRERLSHAIVVSNEGAAQEVESGGYDQET
jgi:hypothetical protein